ncbi:MAG: metallophosphoesterase family protein [Fibrobacteria bacterium]|nr:metallophosphoesterase family protein [Fibrobacteria bacterium]
MAAIGLACVFYAKYVEPDWLRVTEYDLASDSTAITIAHLSDFHVVDQKSLDRVRKAVEILRRRKPDLIAITGDFFTEHLVLESEFGDLLAVLASLAPTYAIGGNHDGGFWAWRRGGYQTTAELAAFLKRSHIRFLENELDTLTIGSRRIQLYGAGDLWAGLCLPASDTVFTPDANSTRILLAGHTHAGQLSLPLLGAPFVPVEDKRCIHGLCREGARWMEVTSGIGNLHGLRFNARPEIVLIRI